MKRVLRYGAAGFLIALAYLGWIALTRYNANQEFEREAAQSETARYKKLVPASTELKITQFYTSKQEAARGESILVCYGVENARSVRIEPPIEEHLPPLPGKCFPFSPHRTTTLKLVAEGQTGGEATASITVRAR
jgi:hypothetical protein